MVVFFDAAVGSVISDAGRFGQTLWVALQKMSGGF
jgi:hypothetical protein